MLPLNHTGNARYRGTATAISKNGKVVGGTVADQKKESTCMWTQKDGEWVLHLLADEAPDGYQSGFIRGISPNGRYAVGGTPTGIPGIKTKACWWDLETGGCSILPSNEEAIANAVNDDGVVALTINDHAAAWDVRRNDFIFREEKAPSKGLAVDKNGRIGGYVWNGYRDETKRSCMWLKGEIQILHSDHSAVKCFTNNAVAGFVAMARTTTRQAMVMKIDK
jgi:uncharacterized membrane protein